MRRLIFSTEIFNAKIVALALVIGFSIGVSAALDRSQPLEGGVLRDPAKLLPLISGPYRLASTSRSEFGIAIDHSVVEQDAIYSKAASGERIEVALMLNQQGAHNAIGCFLARGEKLAWQHMLQVPTKHDLATIALAGLTDGSKVHLVASTQCWKDACEERPAAPSGISLTAWAFGNILAGQSRPVSVVFAPEAFAPESRVTRTPAAAEVMLRGFLEEFDFDPIRNAAGSRSVGL